MFKKTGTLSKITIIKTAGIKFVKCKKCKRKVKLLSFKNKFFECPFCKFKNEIRG